MDITAIFAKLLESQLPGWLSGSSGPPSAAFTSLQDTITEQLGMVGPPEERGLSEIAADMHQAPDMRRGLQQEMPTKQDQQDQQAKQAMHKGVQERTQHDYERSAQQMAEMLGHAQVQSAALRQRSARGRSAGGWNA